MLKFYGVCTAGTRMSGVDRQRSHVQVMLSLFLVGPWENGTNENRLLASMFDKGEEYELSQRGARGFKT